MLGGEDNRTATNVTTYPGVKDREFLKSFRKEEQNMEEEIGPSAIMMPI